MPHPSGPQFHESWQLLLDWLDETEATLETPSGTTGTPEEIKGHLGEHKVSEALPLGQKDMQGGLLLGSCCCGMGSHNLAPPPRAFACAHQAPGAQHCCGAGASLPCP